LLLRFIGKAQMNAFLACSAHLGQGPNSSGMVGEGWGVDVFLPLFWLIIRKPKWAMHCSRLFKGGSSFEFPTPLQNFSSATHDHTFQIIPKLARQARLSLTSKVFASVMEQVLQFK